MVECYFDKLINRYPGPLVDPQLGRLVVDARAIHGWPVSTTGPEQNACARMKDVGATDGDGVVCGG